MNPLIQLHEDIEARVSQIRQQHDTWPCAKGCDHCCRQLARLPQLTATEWTALRTGLEALPKSTRNEVLSRVAAFNRERQANLRPVTCPLLDQTKGTCPVYLVRPVACRTYGFYVQRDGGLYCADIHGAVTRGEMDHVIWGNHEVIDRHLTTLGESRSLDEWFQRDFSGSN